MATITANNNGSLKEIMSQALVDLKAKQRYLTSKLRDGSKLNVLMANNRGFRIAVDYTRNNTIGYMNSDGGNLTGTHSPALDNMTANLQYIQFGQEISGLQLANSAGGAHVGPGAKALAARKMLERRAEMEEYYFCRGDGYQTIGDITGAVATTVGVEATVALSGSRDGLGAYLLGVNQKVRVYSSAYAYKHKGTITTKTSNSSVGYTPSQITTTGIVDGDLVFPDSDSTSPTTTGVKGVPYLVKNSGAYFDKTLSSTPAFKAVIDSSTNTFTRTTMEALYRNSQVRAGQKNPNQRAVCSLAQLSNYYVQFYAMNSAQVHIMGSPRPTIDVGAAGSMDDYTFWGQPIDAYAFIHPKNWWMLDYSTFSRLTLKEAGAMLTPAGQFVQKISSGEYANAQQSWDDDYLEYLSDEPHKNAGFTALTFSGLPGLLVSSPYTGS